MARAKRGLVYQSGGAPCKDDFHKQAQAVLSKVKKDRKGKKFKLVPNPESPRCFIEVEV